MAARFSARASTRQLWAKAVSSSSSLAHNVSGHGFKPLWARDTQGTEQVRFFCMPGILPGTSAPSSNLGHFQVQEAIAGCGAQRPTTDAPTKSIGVAEALRSNTSDEASTDASFSPRH